MTRFAARLSALLSIAALSVAGLLSPSAVMIPRAYAQAGAYCPVANSIAQVKTGTSYTVAVADMCSMLVFNNSGSIAVTLPNPATTFPAGFRFSLRDQGAGTVTLTPTTATINGTTAATIAQGYGFDIWTDGTNYYAQPGGGSGGSGGVLGVAQGGTGAATFTAHGVLLGEGTTAFAAPAAGTTGQAFISGGASADGAYGVTLPVGGGTGLATITAHGVMVGEGTSNVAPTAVGSTGQLLQGATGADPAWATSLSGAYTFTNALVAFGNSAGTPTHIITQQATAPALTSCGSGSPAIAGTDEAGIVTMGTSATGCVITFNVAYTGTPFCVVNWIATPLASQSWVTSNAAITTTQTSTSGNKLQYICRAPAGG